MRPNRPHAAQMPRPIMKINSASYPSEKTQYFWPLRDPGFIFFTLLSSVKGLKADGGVTTNPFLLFPLPIAAKPWQRQIRDEIRET